MLSKGRTIEDQECHRPIAHGDLVDGERMNEEEFRKALDNQEITLGCTFCGADLWVETRNGAPHLMRLAEVPIENCPICTEIHEMIE